MAIQLHSFVCSEKRYIQVESQSYHVIGLFRKILHSQRIRNCEFTDIYSAYFECEEDGTITFYQTEIPDAGYPGIWTYMVYECPEGEEKVYRDSSIDTSIKPLKALLAGDGIPTATTDIYSYLKLLSSDSDFLDVQLPAFWNNSVGREIAELLLEEYKAFQLSSVFADSAGAEYQNTVLESFIQAAESILAARGTTADFEAAQYDVLRHTNTSEVAKLILEINDYRIWQAALPSKSKAVEFAFNTALNLICRMK